MKQNRQRKLGILLNLGAKYTILYAGLTVLTIFLGSYILGYPFGLAVFVLLLGSLMIAPLLFVTTNTELETVEERGEAKMGDITNPSKYWPRQLSSPGKFQIGLYLVGIAVYSVVGLLLI